MACWVVPAVAAELWGTSVQAVLEQVACGQVPSKMDLGFLVVDVAPNSPRLQPAGRQHAPPLTFIPVPAETATAPIERATQRSPMSDETLDWRAVRTATSKLRRPRRADRALAA